MALYRRASHFPLRRPLQCPVARYHDYVRFSTPGGIVRLPLNNPNVLGVASLRGERISQEDFYAYAALSLDPAELQHSLKKIHDINWDPSRLPPELARQVLFVGIYDGHGGSTVSQYLRQELHGLFEHVDKSHIPDVYAWAKELGGYFKRFRGGVLEPWVNPSKKEAKQELDLESRATLAFFEADRVISQEQEAKECGATASVVLLQSLDPDRPVFTSQDVALTVAHVGDTRVLLCATVNGEAIPLTETHHSDARVEAVRLRRMMGTGSIADSFGEVRWMGAVANTRSLGDLKYKPLGVTPEPQVTARLMRAAAFSHITLVSDGVSSMISDEEIVDLARGARSPREAAKKIVDFAEEVGGDDNMTAIVLPLAGWGNIGGRDGTRELRDWRRAEMIDAERRRSRWM